MAESLSEHILRTLPDAVVVVADDGSIRYANARLEQLFGYDEGTLAGRQIEELVPETLGNHSSLRERYFEDPHPRPPGVLELTGRRSTGEEFPVDISLSFIELGGQRLVTAVVREMQERIQVRRELEEVTEQLQVAQRLESIGQLAGGIAHDFNNLLSVILNYAGFAIRALPEGDQSREDVEQIYAAAERAAALTQQLLLFSRRGAAQPEVIDLNTVVTDMERLLRRSIGEQIRLVVSLAGNLHSVFADPHKLEQVLLNLAVNARDAMPGGGTLEIESANVLLDTDAAKAHPRIGPGDYVALTITDEGVGMAKEVAARAFEPFFSGEERGPGLGLATAHGIVTQAGGSITIRTEPGKGTAVTILLPATQKQVSPGPSVETLKARGGETVLVVEDDRAVLELTKRILSHAGYKVIDATSPEAALEACETASEHVDLLLSDMVMPQISGIDLARRIRELQPNVRIAFMTGYSRDFLERHANLGDAVALVEKPFTTERLLKAVRAALDAKPMPLPLPAE